MNRMTPFTSELNVAGTMERSDTGARARLPRAWVHHAVLRPRATPRRGAWHVAWPSSVGTVMRSPALLGRHGSGVVPAPCRARSCVVLRTWHVHLHGSHHVSIITTWGRVTEAVTRGKLTCGLFRLSFWTRNVADFMRFLVQCVPHTCVNQRLSSATYAKRNFTAADEPR